MFVSFCCCLLQLEAQEEKLRLEEEARNAAQREAARLARERKLKEVRRHWALPSARLTNRSVKPASPLTCWPCTEALLHLKPSTFCFIFLSVLFFTHWFVCFSAFFTSKQLPTLVTSLTHLLDMSELQWSNAHYTFGVSVVVEKKPPFSISEWKNDTKCTNYESSVDGQKWQQALFLYIQAVGLDAVLMSEPYSLLEYFSCLVEGRGLLQEKWLFIWI